MEGGAMMGERTVAQEALFYQFSLERHVPATHLLHAIDRSSIYPASARICALSTATPAGPRSIPS